MRSQALLQAQDALRRGDLTTAERICRALLAENGSDADAFVLLGIIAASQGRLDEAAHNFAHAAELKPSRADVHFNLAVVRMEQGRTNDALALFERTLALDPQNRGARAGRTNALFALSLWPAAVTALREQVAANPNDVDSWTKLGVSLSALQDHEGALDSLRRAAALQPNDAVVHASIGGALLALGRFEEAVDSLTRALSFGEQIPEAAFHRAVAHRALGHAALAESDYQRALQMAPGDRRVLASYVEHLQRQDKIAEAGRVLDATSVDRVGARVILGNLLADQMKSEEALAAYDTALAMDPTDAFARYARGLLLLRNGELREGFQGYEYRLQGFIDTADTVLAGPQWDPAAGQSQKRVLLYAEQGRGDTIQFVRFAPVLLERGHEVSLLVPPMLARLCRSLHPRIRVYSGGEKLPDYDAHASLMSLPAKLGVDLESIPAKVPYLSVDESDVARWRSRLSRTPAPRVGICWSGRATHNGDALRSIALDAFEPITKVAGITFVNLLKDVRAAEKLRLAQSRHVTDFMSEVSDFYDTAALVSALDLVISVDTAVVHLAGALGKPVWVLLPFAPDWRWLSERSDSPWYPTARLFRQERSGDWSGVIAQVVAALRDAGIAAVPH